MTAHFSISLVFGSRMSAGKKAFIVDPLISFDLRKISGAHCAENTVQKLVVGLKRRELRIIRFDFLRAAEQEARAAGEDHVEVVIAVAGGDGLITDGLERADSRQLGLRAAHRKVGDLAGGGHDEAVAEDRRPAELFHQRLGKLGKRIAEDDGLRLAAADCVDREFFKRLHSFTKGKREDFWLMGEIIHGDYRVWANDEMLDSVTNYECWKGIYSSHNDKNYFEIAYSLKRQFGQGGLYENLCLYNFLDNHDVNRIGSLLKQRENLKNAYTLLYMMPGIPSIYYGSEWGIEGVKGQGMDADLPLRPKLDIEEMCAQETDLPAHIRELAKIRKESDAVKYGAYDEVLVRNEQFVFARRSGEQYKLIAFNLTDHAETLYFSYQGKEYEVLLEAYTSKIME